MNGEWLRAARAARGWTQSDGAEAAGIALKTWVQAEAGRSVRAFTEAAILKALSSTPEQPAVSGEVGFEDIARLVPKLPLLDLNRLQDMVRTAIAIREGGVS